MQVWERCLGNNPVVQCFFFNFYSEILWIIGNKTCFIKITGDVIGVVTLECGCQGNAVMVVMAIVDIVFV